MTDQPADRRAAPRIAATFRIRLGYSSIDSFLDGYAANISKGGIFVPTKQPRDQGTEVRFELLLKDGSTAIAGVGRVAWTRAFDPKRPGERFGMGVQFLALDASGEEIVRRALAWRAAHLGDKANLEIADDGPEPKPTPPTPPKPTPPTPPKPTPPTPPKPTPPT
ncbi:MAG: TIGR02266 family protein, partial [Deltaproteobacteria bacterium]|nr:TIGR02266 family protein [Deltaproteobacteria bacterium]